MGLQWVRLDVSLCRRAEVLRLLEMRDGFRAAWVYVCGIAYCGEQLNDGHIPAGALPMIHARQIDAGRLVEVGLWSAEDGGWYVNDWDETQLSVARIEELSERGRRRARKRWDGGTT